MRELLAARYSVILEPQPEGAVLVAMRSADVPVAELARRLGWQPLQVRRLLDPRHRARLDRLDEAARALGKALVVELYSAA